MQSWVFLYHEIYDDVSWSYKSIKIHARERFVVFFFLVVHSFRDVIVVAIIVLENLFPASEPAKILVTIIDTLHIANITHP